MTIADLQRHTWRKIHVSTNSWEVHTNSFCYDANGNRLSQSSPQTYYTWTSFNQPSQVSGAFGSSQFFYDDSHQRYKQIANGYADSPETTYYVGGLLEKVATPSGTTYRHIISAGSNTVLVNRISSGTNFTYYIFKDHLGSTNVISDVNGVLVQSQNYSATGIERTSNWAAYNGNSGLVGTSYITHQGFTGQEMDANVGVVNLNGRMLDPSLGRMVSPDPHITYPGNTQSWNRYSYVMNNPLTYTDPTGFDTTPDPNFPGTGGNNIGGFIPLNPNCVNPTCSSPAALSLQGNVGISGLQTATQTAAAAAAGSEELTEVVITARYMSVNSTAATGLAEILVETARSAGQRIATSSIATDLAEIVVTAARMGAGAEIVVGGLFVPSPNVGANCSDFTSGDRSLCSQGTSGNASSQNHPMAGASQSTTVGPGQDPNDKDNSSEKGKDATSSSLAELLKQQLAAEEAAGVRAPNAISSWSDHVLDQIAGRDGGIGVKETALQDAFNNPTTIEYAPSGFGPTFRYTGSDATVVVNPEGRVVTGWATNSRGVP